ncbi:MAG: hypothetical protein LC789_04040 [Actinobacteria bacterium]|nr:hypothetical protein [Actinomycetota bacterium]MCA1721759.1 hypothetical protein [Actinomycetota bacterium]
MAWTWRYEGPDGSTVQPEGVAEPEQFPSQSDAESFIGETWRELLDAGVQQVTLFEGDRKVYGPMALDMPG